MNIPWLKDYSTAPCDPRSFRNQKDLQRHQTHPEPWFTITDSWRCRWTSQIEMQTQLKSLTTQLRNAAVSLEMTQSRVHWTRRNVGATKIGSGVLRWCFLKILAQRCLVSEESSWIYCRRGDRKREGRKLRSDCEKAITKRVTDVPKECQNPR